MHGPAGLDGKLAADLTRTAGLIAELAAQRHEFARQYAERTRQMSPSKNPGQDDPGPAFPELTGEASNATLHRH